MRTSILGKVHFVASKYDPETRAKAVRLVPEHRDDYPSEWAAITAVSKRLGILIRDILRRRNCLPDLCQRGRSRQRVRLRSESLPILPRRRFCRQPTNFCLSASRIQYFPEASRKNT
jgi:transposase-like protein